MKLLFQVRIVVYVLLALVYISKSKKLSEYIPKNIVEFFKANDNEVIVGCYLYLVYYYLYNKH